MGKYLTDINKDSVQEAIRRYNFVIYQLRKFFPLYPYGEEVGYQELFFNGFHDCIPIASYGVSILRAVAYLLLLNLMHVIDSFREGIIMEWY